MDLKETIELCKSGRAEEAYAANRSALESDPTDRWSRLGVGYSLKSQLGDAARSGDVDTFVRLLEEFGDLRLEEIEESELNAKTGWDIRALALGLKDKGVSGADVAGRVFEALKHVNYPRPHRYYSLLLDSFLKLRDADGGFWNGLPEFTAWWGMDNLLPEDYERVRMANGQSMASLAERAYTATLKTLLPDVLAGKNLEAAEAILGDLEILEETHPEYQNILYQKSNLLKAMGRTEEALESAREFVKKRPGDFWAWAALGDVMGSDEERAACYSRAVMCKSDPALQGKVRYKLAVAMYQMGLYPNAKREFEKIAQIYQSRGWHVPPGVEAIMQQDWYRNTPEAPTNRDFYNMHGRRAEEYLYSDVEETPVLISTVNPQKQVVTFVTPDRRRGYFSTKRITYKFNPNHVYMIKFDGDISGEVPSRPLRYRRAEDISAYEDSLFKKVVAEVGLKPGQKFQFVDDIYIDGTLLRGVRQGTTAEVTSVLYYNIKKDAWGWRAIRVRTAQQ